MYTSVQYAKVLIIIPLTGPLFSPPVNVTSMARVAVRAAIDPACPLGIVDWLLVAVGAAVVVGGCCCGSGDVPLLLMAVQRVVTDISKIGG
uniref:Uncharacterized protein n=1 Tax=Quercus lobata TaxID=97700 RepID=A0A7N2M0W3_QUELO